MPDEKTGNSGNKYHRQIRGLAAYQADESVPSFLTIDIYCFLTAYEVRNPGLQHAIKKLACAGIRGKADVLQDLMEARDAVDRAIEDVRLGGQV